MNATTLEVMKAEFARAILTEQDENLLKKTITFFSEEKKAAQAPPCQYTTEELGERLAQSEADIKAGRTFSTAEVFKPYEQWL